MLWIVEFEKMFGGRRIGQTVEGAIDVSGGRLIGFMWHFGGEIHGGMIADVFVGTIVLLLEAAMTGWSRVGTSKDGGVK